MLTATPDDLQVMAVIGCAPNAGFQKVAFPLPDGQHRLCVLKYWVEDQETPPDFAETLKRLAEVSSRSLPEVEGFLVEPDRTTVRGVLWGFVGGDALSSSLEGGVPLTPKCWLATARGLGEALRALHAAGLTHRCMCAANVRFDPGHARVYLVDFGFNPTRAEPEVDARYLAPEIAHRLAHQRSRDEWFGADLYGLGVVLHEAATGRPFGGPEWRSVADQLGSEFASLIRGLLSSSPAQRLESVPAFNTALEEAVTAYRLLPNPEATADPEPRPAEVAREIEERLTPRVRDLIADRLRTELGRASADWITNVGEAWEEFGDATLDAEVKAVLEVEGQELERALRADTGPSEPLLDWQVDMSVRVLASHWLTAIRLAVEEQGTVSFRRGLPPDPAPDALTELTDQLYVSREDAEELFRSVGQELAADGPYDLGAGVLLVAGPAGLEAIPIPAEGST